MATPEKVESGVFVRLSADQIQKLFTVLEDEGYNPDPQGLGAFLSDVSAGKLSEQETPHEHPQGDILEALGKVAKTHGPDLAKAALDLLRRGGKHP